MRICCDHTADDWLDYDPASDTIMVHDHTHPFTVTFKFNGDTAAQLCEALGRPTIPAPIPMLLWCPQCGERHIDVGEFATKSHHTHACQECGHCWRPAVVATVGVQFLPGFKNT